ncbi:hypothetical protein P5V15_011506 [Pogonomyrmex californicus]
MEQTILSAYFIGVACIDKEIIRSSMAIINFDYDCLKNICPTDIEIICCNNQYNNVDNDIYVKEIYCNIPYHSYSISSVKSQILLKLNVIISQPKERSSKWISTSVPRSKWYTSASKLSSAEYHTNSIINTVLFKQTMELIQNNAVIIEIAPYGVLQNILNESLHPIITTVILTERGEKSTDIILQGIGKLYNCGLQTQIANLYPPVEFPVSRGTPMISPSIRWDHLENWFVPTYGTQENIKTTGRVVEIMLNNEDYNYMTGHVIDGRHLLPATDYLALVWQTIGMIKGQMYITVPIIFHDISFIRATHFGGFRGLKTASIFGTKGHIAWTGNWVTFMDTMLQMKIIGYDTKDLYVPTSIQKLIINPILHTSKLQEMVTEEEKQLPIRVYREMDTIIAGGVEIRGLGATQISRRKQAEDAVLEEHVFVAHHDYARISLNEGIRIIAQLALEDHQIMKVKTIELVEDIDNVAVNDLSSSLLLEAFADMPLIQANINLLTSANRFDPTDLSSNILIGDINTPSVDDKALIVAGFNLLTKEKIFLQRFLSFLREGGYLLFREKSNVIDYDKYLQQYELNVILEKRTDEETVVLFKKKVQTGKMITVYINNDDFNWLEDLKLLVNNEINRDKNSRIVIVGENDFECGLLGFINCLRKEPGGELVRGVLIQDEKAPKFSLQNSFYLQQLQKDMAINVLRSNKTWGSYRHLRLPQPAAELVPSAHICQTVKGDLSSFCWIENNQIIDSRHEDLVRVIYSSLNFKDVMLATGKLQQQLNFQVQRFTHMPLGMEYVGFDIDGQCVMGLRDTNCIANIVAKDKDFCWKIPDAWTFEEAATIPCVYSTVYYALYILGKMKKGDKILIHSGTGGIGQAAIHLALHEGCEIFTTVGTHEKRDFIKELFPNILDEHIGNSRDVSFEQIIMRQTHGRGVDIVLNSLAEEKLIASVRCLAQNGRFLEIGKFDMASNNCLNMSLFQKSISFYGILLDNMFTSKHKSKSLLSNMIADGLENGAIKPIRATIFSKSDIEAAFRYMASGQHMGKIIINIQEKDKSSCESVVAYRRYYCLTDWLILRGARNIVLISRTGIKNGYQRVKVRLWESYGVNVQIVKNIDVSDPKDCQHLLKSVERQAPVDAIFNLGVVLKDGILKNQTAETFMESFRSKAWATQTLDKLSRKICPKLRHFVVFSSVSCGLPGLAIQWGAIGDVGLVADMQEDNKELIIGGTLQQKISCCLDELDKFLVQSRPIVSSMVVAEKKTGFSGFNDLVETVANILGVKDIKVVGRNVPFAELGMDSMMTVEVKQTLEREFDIFLTAQELRNLTFAKLNKLSNVTDNTKYNKIIDAEMPNVLKLLVGIVKDKDFISEPCFSLLTKGEDTATQVFLIPGIDGCGTVFNHLASSMNYSTTILHYSTNDIDAINVISDTVDRLAKHILPKLRSGRDFVIAGYSFGSIIAIELTRKLEAMNLKGRLVLIDGTPEQMQTMYRDFTSNSNEVDLQTVVLSNILEIYTERISDEILMELKNCKNWEERYNAFAKQFLGMNTSLSPTNLRILCTSVYKHSAAIRQYDPSTLPRIKSSIILLKATMSHTTIEGDYGLHKITEGVVEIHYIEGSHLTILRNKKIPAAINGELHI